MPTSCASALLCSSRLSPALPPCPSLPLPVLPLGPKVSILDVTRTCVDVWMTTVHSLQYKGRWSLMEQWSVHHHSAFLQQRYQSSVYRGLQKYASHVLLLLVQADRLWLVRLDTAATRDQAIVWSVVLLSTCCSRTDHLLLAAGTRHEIPDSTQIRSIFHSYLPDCLPFSVLHLLAPSAPNRHGISYIA